MHARSSARAANEIVTEAQQAACSRSVKRDAKWG
jgi:hypothetical protein